MTTPGMPAKMIAVPRILVWDHRFVPGQRMPPFFLLVISRLEDQGEGQQMDDSVPSWVNERLGVEGSEAT